MKENPGRTSEGEVASAPDAPVRHGSRNDKPAASRAPLPPRSQRPPTVRLMRTRAMDADGQRRLELLLDLLIERRARRLIQEETENDGKP